MGRAELNFRDGSHAVLSRSKTGSDGLATITLKAPKLRYDDSEMKEKYEDELKPLLGEAVEVLSAEILQESGKHHH